MFYQKFHPVITDVLTFRQLGFTCSKEYTFRTQPGTSADELWEGLDKKTRTTVHTAGKEGIIVEPLVDPDKLCDFYDGRLAEQGKQNLYTTQSCNACAVKRFSGMPALRSAPSLAAELCRPPYSWSGTRRRATCC